PFDDVRRRGFLLHLAFGTLLSGQIFIGRERRFGALLLLFLRRPSFRRRARSVGRGLAERGQTPARVLVVDRRARYAVEGVHVADRQRSPALELGRRPVELGE